ncbi:hypothetical protein [Devosia sp.]|uniref:hypothetical protein n=1 Tax=Devosia sp. TaxID=1871048 RepID=UPI002FCA980C
MMAMALIFAAVAAQAPAPNQRVSQAEIERFVWQVKSCWNILPDDINSGLSVTLLIDLNRDGSVTGNEIGEAVESAAGLRIARAAVRAVEQCAPYTFSAETYHEWKHLELELRP